MVKIPGDRDWTAVLLFNLTVLQDHTLMPETTLNGFYKLERQLRIVFLLLAEVKLKVSDFQFPIWKAMALYLTPVTTDKMLSLSINSKFANKLTVNAKSRVLSRICEKQACRFRLSWKCCSSRLALTANINVDDLRGDPNKLGAIAPGTDPASLAIYGKSVGEEFQQAANNWGQNPWWASYQHINDDIRDRFIASGQIRYDITSWFMLPAVSVWTNTPEEIKRWLPQGVRIPTRWRNYRR